MVACKQHDSEASSTESAKPLDKEVSDDDSCYLHVELINEANEHIEKAKSMRLLQEN